ncbi:MAG TPA: apolipoprotein N-acyltransferase [Candidatus Polarisedimenticolia bacterium]|nr:apolipoprotein N-acyltransferase [Candidatus Polarisedimenticolia bacterium]
MLLPGHTPRRLRRDAALACTSGILLALSYPSADLGALAFIALVPWLLSLRDVGPAASLRRGYLFGFSFFVMLLAWIPRVMVTYGGITPLLAWPIYFLLVLYLASYPALFGALLACAWRRLGASSLIAAPIVWVALELARGRLLTGFPWGLLGYTQYRNIPLLQAAAWGGIYAVSFLVLASNVGLTLLLLRPATPLQRAGGAALLLLVLLAHGGGFVALLAADRAPQGETIPVAAIQPNVAQDRKWSPGAEAQILSDLVRLTREASGARLIVWPEAASPFSFRRPARVGASGFTVEPNQAYSEVVAGLARSLGATLIAGSVDYAAEGGDLRAFNSAFAFGPDGSILRTYDKVHLVPFGEYVPLHRLLFFVDRMAQGAVADFSSGTRLDPLPTLDGGAATSICYEAIFPELVRRTVRKGAIYLVNITNDAWFGRSAAPRQHLAMAVVRAVENRRYLIRAANTGISAVVDPYGRIQTHTGLMESAVLRATVRPRTDRTPYVRSGDLFAWGCVILTVLLGAALRAAFLRRG